MRYKLTIKDIKLSGEPLIIGESDNLEVILKLQRELIELLQKYKLNRKQEEDDEEEDWSIKINV